MQVMKMPSVFFFAALAFAACSGGTTPVSPEPPPPVPAPAGSASNQATSGTEVELRFDETKEAGELELRWLEINDSRCPIGVTCFWEGQAVARLEVRRAPEEAAVEVELVLQPGTSTEPGKAFGVEIHLRRVEPHPKEGVTPERADYVATLEIVGL